LVAIGLVAIAVFVPESTDDWIDEPHERAVQIAIMPCAPSVQSSATGYVIDDRLVLTVAHGIYDSREFAVRDWTGTWHRASVRHVDLERDLALLEISDLRALPTAIGDRLPAGEPVRMIEGASSGSLDGEVIRPVRITTENIGDLSQTSRRSGYELSVPVVGGDSGAAIVDQNDELVGLVFARSTRREAAWATAVSEVEAIRNQRSAASWACELDVDVELILPPLEPKLP